VQLTNQKDHICLTGQTESLKNSFGLDTAKINKAHHNSIKGIGKFRKQPLLNLGKEIYQ